MSTTPPDDAAAMFDLPPLPAAAPSATQELEAAEAALAAELASAIDADDVAADAPDSRSALRVRVSWPARMHLPDGRVIELRVRDVSEGGVGLTSDEHVPPCTVVDFELDVPPLAGTGRTAPVKGTIKTTYTAVHGAEFRCGGTWVQVPATDRELVGRWIRRLRD
jgi:hypothetical protein